MSRDLAQMKAELAYVASLPEAEAQSLPGRFYTDPAFFAHEVDEVLGKEWHCLGRTDELAGPGSYFVTTLLQESLLVVRGDDGRIRVLSNVCRHRGMPVAEGFGVADWLVCPYHGWSYDRQGVLGNAPRMRDKGVTPATCRLPELPTEIWHGFIYVNLDPNAAPLAPRLEKLGSLLKNYRTQDMRIVHVAEEDWRTNWKCLVENFMEAYHLSVVHPQTLHPYTPTGLSRKSMADEAFTSYCANYPRNIPSRGTGAPGLTEEERHRSTLFCLFPTQVVSQAASTLVSLSLQPVAVDLIHVRWTMSVYGDDLTPEMIQNRIAVWNEVNREDREKLEKMQKTLGSRFAPSGPLAPTDFEGTIWDFYRYLARRLSDRTQIDGGHLRRTA
jgi:phenylpropionate dioxygenase-like ring-hydroxylating dioxygenase large terminal subunit